MSGGLNLGMFADMLYCLQTLLFSATMPSALHEFAKAGLKEPEMVRLDTDTRISQDLATAFFTVRYSNPQTSLDCISCHKILFASICIGVSSYVRLAESLPSRSQFLKTAGCTFSISSRQFSSKVQ